MGVGNVGWLLRPTRFDESRGEALPAPQWAAERRSTSCRSVLKSGSPKESQGGRHGFVSLSFVWETLLSRLTGRGLKEQRSRSRSNGTCASAQSALSDGWRKRMAFRVCARRQYYAGRANFGTNLFETCYEQLRATNVLDWVLGEREGNSREDSAVSVTCVKKHTHVKKADFLLHQTERLFGVWSFRGLSCSYL